VPFVRVSRDKRGYEHIYLFEVSSRRPRILYWFRTPPGVRVGREPFDEPVKRALEAQNPGVTFDWKKLASDTLPPPDVENWRERRRAEREAKRARRVDEEETAGGGDEEPVGEAQASEVSAGEMRDDLPAEAVATVGAASDPSFKPVTVSGAGDAGPFGRHRRRRRGGRHRQSTRRPDVPVAPQVDSPPAEHAERNRTMEAAQAPSGASLPMSSMSDTANMTADWSEEKKMTADSSEVKMTADSPEEK
jgi:hypothetical protein